MLSEIKPAILITLIFTVITGLVYPAAITGLSQLLFSRYAPGMHYGSHVDDALMDGMRTDKKMYGSCWLT